MKQEKQIYVRICENKKCGIEFKTHKGKKLYCCESCRTESKLAINGINTDSYIKIETFVAMIKETLFDVLRYLKDHQDKYYTKLEDWYVHEDLFKVFTQVKTIHQL